MFKHTLLAGALVLAPLSAHAKQADAVEAFTKATPAAKDALRRDVCQPSDAGLKTLGTDDDLAAYRAVKAALRNANVGFCKAAK